MRPGYFSQDGFLGQDESLLEVIASDAAILQKLKVSYYQISIRIRTLLRKSYPIIVYSESDWQDIQRLGYRANGLRILHPASSLKAQAAEYLDTRRGNISYSIYRDENPSLSFLVDGRYQIEICTYKGTQNCPWCGQSSGWDGIFKDVKTGETLCISGTLLHLIEDHHFFEGHGTPYRLDPERAVKFFRIDPEQDYSQVVPYRLEIDPGDTYLHYGYYYERGSNQTRYYLGHYQLDKDIVTIGDDESDDINLEVSQFNNFGRIERRGADYYLITRVPHIVNEMLDEANFIKERRLNDGDRIYDNWAFDSGPSSNTTPHPILIFRNKIR